MERTSLVSKAGRSLLHVLAVLAIALPSAASTCPSAGTVHHGVDVSEFQGTVDWNAVAASGHDFAYIRVTDGLDVVDEQLANNWAGTKAAGIRRGAYQFFRPNEDAVAQAQLLLALLGSLGPGDLPPALVVEVSDGMNPQAVADGARAWVQTIRQQLQVTPLIYTSAGLWANIAGNSSDVSGAGLWVGNWGVACPTIPNAWQSWTFWQYADNGTVAGIAGNVDLDLFVGDLDHIIVPPFFHPPQVTVESPVNFESYALNQPVLAQYSCTAGTLPLAMCMGSVPSGAPVDTSTVGNHEFDAIAVDTAGNRSWDSLTYQVVYHTCPLYDEAHVVHGGATIPLKVALCDYFGADVSTPSQTVVATSLNAFVTTPKGPAFLPIEALNLPFRYDATLGTSGGYILPFSTKGLAPGRYQVSMGAMPFGLLFAVLEFSVD